jgi:ubiquinol oxidase
LASLWWLCLLTTHSFLLKNKSKTIPILARVDSKLFSSSNKRKVITDSSQYLTAKDRKWLIGSKPNNSLLLGLTNFKKEVFQIIENIRLETIGKTDKESSLPDVLGLHLSNEVVKAAEELREKTGGRVNAHPISRALYDLGCYFLDKFFDNRPIERFWFLETVARMPYFAYVSVLHLYESLGWLRAASMRKVHNAEEWNELHHLLIMESLGGDRVSKFYYITFIYMCSCMNVYLFISTCSLYSNNDIYYYYYVSIGKIAF